MVPYEIPSTWEWVRFSTIAELQSGQDLTPDKYNNLQRGIPYITGASNIEHGKVIINRWTEHGRAFASKGDLLITCKGTVGAMAVLKEEQVHIARQIMAIKPFSGISLSYLQCVLETLVAELKAVAKSMIPGIARKDVLSSLIPIPPISEQNRIVQKMDELEPYLCQYAAAYSEVEALNVSFPEMLKKSILQMAVQGKLAPQDPADEPASVLLERIRVEKQRLIAEGKIKRDKHESIIFRRDNSHYEKLDGIERCIDDDVPFDIPNSWQWVRLHQLCRSIADGDHQPPPQVPKGIPFLVISNVSSGRIDFSHTRYVPQSYFESLQWNRIPYVGDLLFTVTGSYGIVLPVDTSERFCFQRHIALIKPIIVDANFLSLWLSSPLVYEQCREKATGTAQKTVGLNTLRDLLIPLPPYQEQLRIKSGLHQILPHIQSITTR